MANIYGRSDSERKLLDLYSNRFQGIGDIGRFEAQIQRELLDGPKGTFGRFRMWRLKKQYKELEEKRDDPYQAGAKGEIQVLDRLSKLSDDYHVLCGVQITLPHHISYNGKKNLKSAQIDFVVVSKKGVYIIEVKNWSDSYVKRQDYFSPHEQAGRAGRLLWHVLKSWRKAPKVTSIVLSIKGNIKKDPKYKVVLVSDIQDINRILEERKHVLSEKEVKRYVKKIKDHVTK